MECQFHHTSNATQFNVTGFGEGSAKCTKEVQIKIARKFAEQQPAVEQYQANIAEGSGEHLPAIMGLL
eukprot:10353781-Karenia_brevis.AAC.1